MLRLIHRISPEFTTALSKPVGGPTQIFKKQVNFFFHHIFIYIYLFICITGIFQKKKHQQHMFQNSEYACVNIITYIYITGIKKKNICYKNEVMSIQYIDKSQTVRTR